jgi:4-hydroxybenzoate polyprenyltransferase
VKVINNLIAAPGLVSALHLFVFGSVILVYNTPRIIKRPYGRARKTNKNRSWYLLFFFTGLGLSVFELYHMPGQILMLSCLLSLLAFAYFLPVLPFRDKKRLRDFGWLKIVVLAGVWTASTSILPVLYWDKRITDYPVEVLLRLVFIFTICIVFDIRDMQADKKNNIFTLPGKLGLRNSYRLINTTLLLFVFLSVVQYLKYPSMTRLAGAFFTAIVTKAVVEYLRKNPSERGYSGLADGVMIVYAMVILIPA